MAVSDRAAALGALVRKRRARELNRAGGVFVRAREGGKARSCFEEAISETPHAAACHHNLGVACLLQAELAKAAGTPPLEAALLGDALAAFTEAVRLDPGMAAAASNATALLLRRGDAADAEAVASACLDCRLGAASASAGAALREQAGADPDVFRLVCNLATALRVRGAHGRAVATWRGWMDLGPDAAALAPGSPRPGERHGTVLVCALWGSKYGPRYVVALARALARTWSEGADAPPGAEPPCPPLVCVTDAPREVDDAAAAAGVTVVTVPFASLKDSLFAPAPGPAAAAAPHGTPAGDGRPSDEGAWPGWWNKARLVGSALSARLAAGFGHATAVFLDLDVVVTSSLRPLVALCDASLDGGADAVALSAATMPCEGRDSGANSSVLAWRTRHPPRAVLEQLRPSGAAAIVHRFDHWLEVLAGGTCEGAATGTPGDGRVSLRLGLIACGGCEVVSDFAQARAAPDVGRFPSLVVFPLSPKPHELEGLDGASPAGRLHTLWSQ